MIHAIANHHDIQAPMPDPDVRAFVAGQQAGVWRYLRALGCESARAEEHCQDALLAALHHQVHLLPSSEASRWLRRTAKNLYLMQLRNERRRPKWVDLDEIDAAWVALRGDDDGGASALTRLSRCLLALQPRERELVARRYERGESRKDIARSFGIGDAGVKQALRRVRDKLRECVQKHASTNSSEPQTDRS